MNASAPMPGDVPAAAVSPWLLQLFRTYSRRYLARHFHAVRLSARAGLPAFAPGRPLIVYLNHAAWWDPLIALLLAERFFPGRPAFAPIDGRQLRKFRFFGRLGFFGVEPGTLAGARAFLQAAESILANPGAMLWLTPQARFCDVRVRPPGLNRGLAGLARRFPQAVFLPLAIEYPFWDARLPEALAGFGEALVFEELQACDKSPAPLAALLEERLARAMDSLAADALSRDPARFVPVLAGAGGVSFAYDLWRRLGGALRSGPPAQQRWNLPQ